MTEKFEEVGLPVTTWDNASSVELTFRDGNLVLSFLDHASRSQVVRFDGVAGYQWSRERADGRQLRDDRVYEVSGSAWVQELEACASVLKSRLKHLVIGFNEESAFLEVVCQGFAVVAE